MNRVAQPVSPDDEALDALLGAFFKAEVPADWPAFQPPRPRVLPFRPAATPAKRRGFFLGSRAALAASVALLLLASWMMPRGPMFTPTGPSSIRRSDGGADKKDKALPDILHKDLFKGLEDAKKPAEKDADNNVKSSLRFEQKDGRGAIRIDVEELPSNK